MQSNRIRAAQRFVQIRFEACMVSPASIPGGDVHAERRRQVREGRANSAKPNNGELSPLELQSTQGLPLAGPNASVHSDDIACCREQQCKSVFGHCSVAITRRGQDANTATFSVLEINIGTRTCSHEDNA